MRSLSSNFALHWRWRAPLAASAALIATIIGNAESLHAASSGTTPADAIVSASASAPRTDVRYLFNGKDLQGWQQVGPGSFVVEHGLLKTIGGMGMLSYIGEKFSNVTLRVVFKLTGHEPDSGVFIRIPEIPTDPWQAINTGYEVEIGEWPDEYGRTGAIYSFSPVLVHAAKPQGQWNTMEIFIQGPRTVVRLNGVKVNDYREGQNVPFRALDSGKPAAGHRQDSGYIGLQNHTGGAVYFKEVSVRPTQVAVQPRVR